MELNANPRVHESVAKRRDYSSLEEALAALEAEEEAAAAVTAVGSVGEGEARDPFDPQEIFDLIRDINDPEHPLTLEQLNVAQLDLVSVDDEGSSIVVQFTPTIPHCSMATLIGLQIRVRLLRSLPSRFKVTIRISPGAHASEDAINKQLNDKERIQAAMENSHLLSVVNKGIGHIDERLSF